MGLGKRQGLSFDALIDFDVSGVAFGPGGLAVADVRDEFVPDGLFHDGPNDVGVAGGRPCEFVDVIEVEGGSLGGEGSEDGFSLPAPDPGFQEDFLHPFVAEGAAGRVFGFHICGFLWKEKIFKDFVFW